jgi:hypothetical protein
MEVKKPLPAGVPDHVLQFGIDMESTPGSVAQKRAAVARMLQRIREVARRHDRAAETFVFRYATIAVRDEDRGSFAHAADPMSSRMELAAPGYFDLIGVPLLRGNDLAPTSDTSATMIIGSDLARHLWGNADPIGRRFTQLSPVQAVKRDIVVSGVYDSRYFENGHNAPMYRAVNNLVASDLSDSHRRSRVRSRDSDSPADARGASVDADPTVGDARADRDFIHAE